MHSNIGKKSEAAGATRIYFTVLTSSLGPKVHQWSIFSIELLPSLHRPCYAINNPRNFSQQGESITAESFFFYFQKRFNVIFRAIKHVLLEKLSTLRQLMSSSSFYRVFPHRFDCTRRENYFCVKTLQQRERKTIRTHVSKSRSQVAF